MLCSLLAGPIKYKAVCLLIIGQVEERMAQLSKQSWIDAALTMLSKHGASRLSIVKLAESLGVTRGSFYYHFDSLNDLIDAMIARWEKEVIDKGFETAHASSRDATEEVHSLIEFVSRLTDKQDLLFRQWAAHNDQVRTHMERLDSKRLAVMTDLFKRLAGDERKGEAYAKIAFYGYIGCLNSFPRPSAQKQKQLSLEILEMLKQDLNMNRMESQ